MEFLAQIFQETLDGNKWVNIVTVHRAAFRVYNKRKCKCMHLIYHHLSNQASV